VSIAVALGVAAVVTSFLAMAFHHLKVEDHGDDLAIHLALPPFRRTVRYADITKVKVGRTMVLEGWGIHYSIRGGWIWNLWGRDCVIVHWRNGGMFQIGTDNEENLVRFLEGKFSERDK
jgi:hypothetical protein